MDIFEEISGEKKRSLASKYLHFHLPKLFYLYDARSKEASAKLVRADRIERINRLGNTAYDGEYVKHISRMCQIHEYIKCKYGDSLSPRELDALLLKYYK